MRCRFGSRGRRAPAAGVWNLLSNAIKFTPGGGRVEIRLERLESHVQIKVSDTGKGIQADFLPHVFDPFRQADASPSRTHGGLGLGLAIVHRLVDLHGGAVQARSEGLGTGATFTVRLPLVPGDLVRKDKGKTHEALGEAVLGGLRTLMVEDDPDTCHFLTILLESHGVKVSSAASAKEALRVFRASRPDVLICDIGLPGEDGYHLLRQIRALGAEKGGNTPALALTAYAGLEHRQRVLAAGFQMHVMKPVDPLWLIRAIEEIVRTPPAVADKAAKERSRRTVFKVVVVDDSKDLADLFAAMLSEMGHDVHVFNDGPALAEIGEIKPEVVFSDISMRQMDGYKLAKRIRQMPELRSSTLVAMTGFGQAGNAGHTLRAGFDYHLVKPVLMSQLTAFFASLAAET